MKIKYTVTLMFLWFFYNMAAQSNYSIDLDLKTMPTQNIKSNEANLSANYSTKWYKYIWSATLEANTKSFHYVAGDFNSNTSFTGFKRINIPIALSYAINKKINLSLQVEPFVGYESKINFEAITLLGGFHLDYVYNAKSTIAIGLRRTALLGKPSVIPFITYHYKPNPQWQLDLGFPETKISYAKTAFTTISIRNSFNGSWYTTDTPGTKASFSQISPLIELQQNMDTNWYITIKAGYDLNRKYLLMDNRFNTTYDFNISNGYNFGITIKYKH